MLSGDDGKQIWQWESAEDIVLNALVSTPARLRSCNKFFVLPSFRRNECLVRIKICFAALVSSSARLCSCNEVLVLPFFRCSECFVCQHAVQRWLARQHDSAHATKCLSRLHELDRPLVSPLCAVLVSSCAQVCSRNIWLFVTSS